MNKAILNTGVQDFIIKKLNADIMSVLLKRPFFNDITNQELVEQLEARKKCEIKLPTWFETPKIYFPNKLNIEQTSSEITARYKAEIPSGKSLCDATGGLGVDSYFFSKKIDHVYHFEIDENLSQIAAHNFEILGAENIKTIPIDGMDFLRYSKTVFQWLYLDPSRRNDIKGKVFRLSDCLPNILEHLELLFDKSENILLKTSPLLDFSVGISELHSVKEIHVVAVENEVKELLWILKKGFKDEIAIKTINFTKSRTESFDFDLSEENNVYPSYSKPLSYLYEPNPAIMKSGAFKLLANRFHLQKLHEHTHLYTSDKLIDFPGRSFNVEEVLTYNKKSLKKLTKIKANITTRNFPEKVASLKVKMNAKDGGDVYLFFSTGLTGKKIILICSKAKQ